MKTVKAVFSMFAFVVLMVIWSFSYSIIFLTFPVWCWSDPFREKVILKYMYWANDAMKEFTGKIDDILE